MCVFVSKCEDAVFWMIWFVFPLLDTEIKGILWAEDLFLGAPSHWLAQRWIVYYL